MRNALNILALFAVAVAPFAYGSYPQWVSGFAVAAFCTLGILHVAVALIDRDEIFAVPPSVRILAYALLAGLAALVAYDQYAGLGAGRTPALSLRQLPYAFAFLSAAMLGAAFRTAEQRRTLLWMLTIVGGGLALLALVQRLGWDIKTFKHFDINSPDRPSGIYVNPNRLAVMLSLCLSAALALFADSFSDEDEQRFISNQRRFLERFALVALFAVMAAGFSVTLSRLTMIAYALALGAVTWVWMRRSRASESRDDAWQLPIAERVQRAALIALPLVVIAGWLAWSLAFGGQRLTERLFGQSLAGDRLAALQNASPLFLKSPLLGLGLGTFDMFFAQLQSFNMDGRWNRLHWDWLQFAIEAGFPAFVLLLALAAAFVRAWWKSYSARLANPPSPRDEFPPPTPLLQLLPFAGCATVMLCAIADFPVRETSLAIAFFFLSGSLASIRIGTRASSPLVVRASSLHSPLRWLIAPLLVAAFAFSAFIAGRNALAAASTPWLRQWRYPPVPGPNLAAWERGIAIDPDEPQLHYFLALGASQTPHADPAVYEKGLEHARLAAAITPRDYLIPWTASSLSEKLGRPDEAEAYARHALELAPNAVKVHEDLALLYLRLWIRPLPAGSFRRAEGVAKALTEFRWLSKYDSRYEERAKNWFLDSGADPGEIVGLWPGLEPHQVVARAKFDAEQDEWFSVARELGLVDSERLQAGTWEYIWYHALSGIWDFQRDNAASGVAHWGAVADLPQSSSESRAQAMQFVAGKLRDVGSDTAERLAAALGPKLKDFPGLLHVLASRLADTGKWVAADTLLRATAGSNIALNCLWTGIALALDDESAAEDHAGKALEAAQDSEDLKKWHARVMQDIEARRKRRREKG